MRKFTEPPIWTKEMDFEEFKKAVEAWDTLEDGQSQ